MQLTVALNYSISILNVLTYIHIQAKRFIDPPIKEPFGLQIFSLQVSSFESTVNCTLHLPLFFSRLALHKYGEMDILTLFVARPVLSIRIFLPIMTILGVLKIIAMPIRIYEVRVLFLAPK